jgi:hypothetical protein
MRNILSDSVLRCKERVGILKKRVTSRLSPALSEQGDSILSGMIFRVYRRMKDVIHSTRTIIPGEGRIQKLIIHDHITGFLAQYSANKRSHMIVFDSITTNRQIQRWIADQKTASLLLYHQTVT